MLYRTSVAGFNPQSHPRKKSLGVHPGHADQQLPVYPAKPLGDAGWLQVLSVVEEAAVCRLSGSLGPMPRDARQVAQWWQV